MKRFRRITMPKWPAYLMAGLCAACAVPAITAPSPAAADPTQESYRAVGQEPGWLVTIAGGQIDYAGDYGETRIRVPRPDPRPSFNGRRYETPRLTVDVTYSRCQDAMSGQAYEHQVTVLADGKAVRGCGGARLSS